MSNKFDDIKNKVRSSDSGSVHSEFIAPKPERRIRSKKFVETHSQDTLWLRNDLKSRLNEEFEKYGKGEKTRIINEALEEWFKKNS